MRVPGRGLPKAWPDSVSMVTGFIFAPNCHDIGTHKIKFRGQQPRITVPADSVADIDFAAEKFPVKRHSDDMPTVAENPNDLTR
jgi:hypothetical protein